jgi:hypothetical protein
VCGKQYEPTCHPVQVIWDTTLGERGQYIGIDVTHDSVVWCQTNITPKYPNFLFHHFDAVNELYNPHGRRSSLEFALPVPGGSVDRIFLASVFTHILEEEVLHCMTEFARALKPDGLAYATFFLHSAEALYAARAMGRTPWKATFDIPLGDGVFANDPAYLRGAVAFTDAAMRRLMVGPAYGSSGPISGAAGLAFPPKRIVDKMWPFLLAPVSAKAAA